MSTWNYPDQNMEPPFEHDDETVDGAHTQASVEWHRMNGKDRAEIIDNLAIDPPTIVREVLRLSRLEFDSDAYDILKACHEACRLEADHGVLQWRLDLEDRQPEHVPLLDKWIRRAAAEHKIDALWCDDRAEEILAGEEE